MSFIKIDELDSQEFVPGFWSRLVHGEKMTFSHCVIQADAELPEHSHEHEQLSYIIEGILEFTLEGVTKIVTPGKLIVIPSNAKHSVKALTDSEVIDIFQPVRETYR